MAKDNKPATGNDSNDDEPLGEAGKRALQAERERARKAEADAKAARDELDKLKAASDSSKSEIEKLTEQVTKLTDRAEESERKALIAEIAEEKGLTAKQAKRLTGKTREELVADADDVIETFGIKSDTDDDSGDGDGESGAGGGPGGEEKPRPAVKDLKSGAVPKSTAGGKSGEDLAAEVWKRTHGEF